MPSFTLHALDPELDRRITEAAHEAGLSKNRFIQEQLRRVLGLAPTPDPHDDFGAFCGVWSEAEKRAFDRTQEESSRIEPDEWRA